MSKPVNVGCRRDVGACIEGEEIYVQADEKIVWTYLPAKGVYRTVAQEDAYAYVRVGYKKKT